MKALKLGGMQESLPLRLEQAQEQRLGYTEFPELLLGDEIERRASRALASRLGKARFEADEADARQAAAEARWDMRVTLSLRNYYERVEVGRAIPLPAPTELSTDDLLDRLLVIGTPETVRRQIRRL